MLFGLPTACVEERLKRCRPTTKPFGHGLGLYDFPVERTAGFCRVVPSTRLLKIVRSPSSNRNDHGLWSCFVHILPEGCPVQGD